MVMVDIEYGLKRKERRVGSGEKIEDQHKEISNDGTVGGSGWPK